jgi:hypothetical protein
MDIDVISTIAELQGQVIGIRRAASMLTDAGRKECYLALAAIIEQFAREFDRTAG